MAADPDQFVKAVEEGMRLSKRLYMGKENSFVNTTPPESVKMGKQQSYSYLPMSPMIYAVISDPSVVDNPDIPSYQPHVHGRCDPPALIPLHMNDIKMEVDCYLDTAFVTITGSWRVHCVMRSRRCVCRLAVPMGEQGSVLGVEVVASGKSYSTQLIAMEEEMDTEKVVKSESGGFLEPQLFTLTIPKVEGGSMLSVKVTWSQKLLYSSGQFSLSVPFNFPEFVTPPGTGICKREKIMLSACSTTGTEVLFMSTSHPLKHTTQQVGKLVSSYEAEVVMWSNTDFNFSYAVSSSDILGGLFLHSPSMQDFDQREMFCLYLLPGTDQIRKVFRKEVIFLIDISGSMQGWPLESVKTALSAALSNLNAEDSFSIIAFNGETCVFSSTLELATKKTIANAAQWMSTNFIAGGSTNILLPLSQAMAMLSDARDSIPLIFLITDGAVDDERHICELVRSQRKKYKGSRFPRITTFGIGAYCNHYFLRMLALIGGGHYDAAYCPDSVDTRIQRLFTTASSVVLANITIDNLDHLDATEVYPSHIPDLSSGSPLIVSGRYQGNFPECLKVRGIMKDMSNFTVSFKVQKAKEIPLDKIVAKQQIDLLTAEAWFAESKQLEEKVMKISIESGISSEYTRMILVESDGGKQPCKSVKTHEVLDKINLQSLLDSKGNKIILVRSLGIGFGNTTATVENLPPRFGGPILPDAEPSILVKAASSCCSTLADRICCMCCIQTCNRINDQLAVVVTQLCTALSCLACLSCCAELCFD